MSYHKVNYVPSSDKTEKGQWNDFDSDRWKEFQDSLGVKDDSIKKGGAITFVDIEESKDESDYGYRYWKNDFAYCVSRNSRMFIKSWVVCYSFHAQYECGSDGEIN